MRLVLLLVLLALTNCVYFELIKRFCIGTEEIPNQKFHFYFEASDNQDAQEAPLILTVVNKHGHSLFSEQATNHEMELPGDIPLTICFNNPSATVKYVTFDLWTDSSHQIKQLAIKSDILNLHEELMEWSDAMMNISKMEKLQIERQDLHSEIILKFEHKIKWLGISKFLLIAGVAVAEIMVLRWVLGKEDRVLEI